ncbi:hypothetical protein AVBRAN12642_09080 [Campylobacter sp. RM12642]|uniref:hypothetical protein n=1 Tax=Campylobacter sp. RM12642 TaxID=2735736 RepID=UPI0030153140|nr:hypothetical protein [Campylobacter sp. RM12642]
MVKKVLLSSVLAGILSIGAFAEETKNQEVVNEVTTPKEESVVSQNIKPSVDEVLPISDENNGFVDDENDILRMMSEVAEQIEDKASGREAFISPAIPIPVFREDPKYYDYLASAYSEAFLRLKAKIVMEKYGIYQTKAILSGYGDDLSDADIDKLIEQEIKSQKEKNKTAENIINALIKKIVGDDAIKEQELIYKAEKIKNSQDFKTESLKTAFGAVNGLIPYENYIVKGKNGYDQVGLVAYISPKSIELAEALKGGYLAKPTAKKEQCKNARELANSIKTPLSKLGLTFFYDENCQPALISYGMKNYENKGKFADRKAENAIKVAQMKAEQNLAMFIGTQISTKERERTVQRAMEKVAVEVKSKDGIDEQTGGLVEENAISTVFQENMSASASMKLIGTKIVNNWRKTKGEQGVTGVMVYYSPASVHESKSGLKPTQAITPPTNTSKVIRSKNVEVDDF